MLERYNKDVHPVGEGLSEEVRVYHVNKVLTTFMKVGMFS